MYFGVLPDNFGLWLKSCEYNPTINWMVFTNDKTNLTVPNNVQIIYFDKNEFIKRVQKKIGINIVDIQPYKLCDFKVAYGNILDDYIKDFDFWGYCDLDLLFGNIRHFVTDSILDRYDKIYTRGHLAIFKNDTLTNKLYQHSSLNKNYKEVFLSKKNYSFDEWGNGGGINEIFLEHNRRIYDEIDFHDVLFSKYRFYPYQKYDKKTNYIYEWSKGDLRAISNKNEKIEIIYAHFQKRKFKTENIHDGVDSVIIYPNRYLITNGDQVNYKKYLKKKQRIYVYAIKLRVKNLLKKIRNKRGEK